ncbi:MAG: heme ABC transporter permease [Pseudomonadota bacterium]
MLKINISPSNSLKFIDKYLRFIILLMLILFFSGSYFAFLASPADYQQGEYVRIMYIHVPSAWISLGCYSLMAVSSFIYLVWNNPMYDLISKSSAPIGALFCFVTLVTGAFWGKPIWGTWWAWDARLTSMLILFFFYIGYIVLSKLTKDQVQNKAAAALAIFGFINVPIVKFSVNLWNSLHQPASILKAGGPSIHNSMLLPLVLMSLSFCFYFLANLLINIKQRLIEQKNLRIILRKIIY